MPTPREDETREDFVARCIPIVLEDGTAKTQEQAVAVCNSYWEQAQEEWEAMKDWFEFEVTGDSQDLGFAVKFVGSPRNPYGTHASKGYPGGRDAWKAAWRAYLAGVRDQGPIQGTVRRVSMIAAGMKPACNLPEMSSEDLGPRPGGDSPKGKVYERPSDYGLSQWKKPSDDDLTQEDIRLTCQDLQDIKRICLQEIAYRREKREKEENKAIKLVYESPDYFLVGGYGHVWGDAKRKDLHGEYFTSDTDLMPSLVPVKLVLFDHALNLAPDGSRFDHPLGKALEQWSQVDSMGKWIQAQLDKRAQYVDEVMELVEKGVLAWSSGSVPHLVKRRNDGWLERWPVIEYALTPTPAEPRMTDVQRIKAAYKAAGLELPIEALLQNAEGPQVKAGAADALRLAQVKLNLLKLN